MIKDFNSFRNTLVFTKLLPTKSQPLPTGAHKKKKPNLIIITGDIVIPVEHSI